MYLPALDWDAVDMGKTIALKLTKKEEQFIADINSRGITNSELLRLALRQYIESMPEFSSEGSSMRTMFVKQDHVSTDVFETVQQLKSEMQRVHCQLEQIQKQVQDDVQMLHQRLGRLSPETSNNPACASTMQQGEGTLYEIHHQIDEFLEKHPLQGDEEI
jgi:metal-responsive CopG/Arc/MetJ family transcriptional regulator